MKKLLSFVLLLGFAYTMNAQYTIIYDNNDMDNGDTITVRTTSSDMELLPHFRNNFESDKSVVVAIDKIGATNVQVLSVCAGIHCYNRSYTDPFTIAAGETYTQFHSDIMIPSPTDKGLFCVRIYNSDNYNERTELYVNILGSEATLGIDAVADQVSLNAYPNPANGSVTVSYANAHSNSTLVIYNMQGAKVHQQSLEATEGAATVQVDDLPAGVYMYGLETSSHRSPLQKLVIR